MISPNIFLLLLFYSLEITSSMAKYLLHRNKKGPKNNLWSNKVTELVWEYFALRELHEPNIGDSHRAWLLVLAC